MQPPNSIVFELLTAPIDYYMGVKLLRFRLARIAEAERQAERQAAIIQ
jgi:hypothetical protein